MELYLGMSGRISNNKFSTFGDNIVSITVLDENLNLKKINKFQKSFYKIIGGMGIFQTIISAEIKVQSLKITAILKVKTSLKVIVNFKIFF